MGKNTPRWHWIEKTEKRMIFQTYTTNGAPRRSWTPQVISRCCNLLGGTLSGPKRPVFRHFLRIFLTVAAATTYKNPLFQAKNSHLFVSYATNQPVTLYYEVLRPLHVFDMETPVFLDTPDYINATSIVPSFSLPSPSPFPTCST